MPVLKAERVLIEAEEKRVANDFRLKRLGKIFFERLRVEMEESKVEAEKDKFKAALRNKVSSWLQELDNKPVGAAASDEQKE